MLSYRHSFHAGNFADVLKHTVSVAIFNHLLKKDKPFLYLDTHAGCGAYSLYSEQALKTKEANNGIKRLWERQDLPPAVSNYMEQVIEFNAQKDLKHYPGSPSIAQQMLRDEDRLFLFELHPNEFTNMSENFASDRRIKMAKQDGLQGLIANIPPKERRAFILIDPSYEIKTDYQDVVETLIKATKRFSTGTYALWYPVVNRIAIKAMERELKGSGIKNIQLFELGIEADKGETGMTSSGMIVINPPWTLMADMRQSLPYLAKLLAKEEKGFYRIETLVAE